MEFQPVSRHVIETDPAQEEASETNPIPISESIPDPVAESEPLSELKPEPEPLPESPALQPEPAEEIIPESEAEVQADDNEEASANTENAENTENVELTEETPQETQATEAEPTPEPEPEPEPRDGRVEVPNVQNFVSDRIRGQIEFKGKGRTIVNIPQSLDFRLTNNTSVQLSFKIDAVGIPYDIEMPPVPRDIERALTDFVLRMRFSAVLYEEPDSAGMRVDLQVR